MFSKLVVTSVALSAAANAMLLPPKLNLPAKLNLPDVFAHLPELKSKLDNLGPARTGQERATVNLACHDCPLAVGSKHGHPLRWEDADGADTTLIADITSDGSQLFFNGAPIYPQAAGPLGQLIAAKQVYADKDASHPHDLYTHALPLSTGIEVHPAVKHVAFHLDTPNAKEVVETVAMRRVTIEILGLADRVVHADTLEIKFGADDLKIHDARVLSYASQTSPEADQCTDIFCRVRVSLQRKVAHLQHFIQSKLHGWRHKAGKGKGCHQNKHTAHKHKGQGKSKSKSKSTSHGHKASDAIEAIKGGMAKFGGKFDEAGHFKGFGNDATPTPHMQTRPHSHHHGHHHSALHRLAHGAVSFTLHILLPVVFGVAAGMVVSGVGMLVGQLIILVVRRVLGRSRNDGYEVVLVEDQEALDEQDLPKYEEVYVAPPPFEADQKFAPQE